jgi:hypothetical protein
MPPDGARPRVDWLVRLQHLRGVTAETAESRPVIGVSAVSTVGVGGEHARAGPPVLARCVLHRDRTVASGDVIACAECRRKPDALDGPERPDTGGHRPRGAATPVTGHGASGGRPGATGRANSAGASWPTRTRQSAPGGPCGAPVRSRSRGRLRCRPASRGDGRGAISRRTTRRSAPGTRSPTATRRRPGRQRSAGGA